MPDATGSEPLPSDIGPLNATAGDGSRAAGNGAGEEQQRRGGEATSSAEGSLAILKPMTDDTGKKPLPPGIGPLKATAGDGSSAAGDGAVRR
mgnify:CR=1 FL=1